MENTNQSLIYNFIVECISKIKKYKYQRNNQTVLDSKQQGYVDEYFKDFGYADRVMVMLQLFGHEKVLDIIRCIAFGERCCSNFKECKYCLEDPRVFQNVFKKDENGYKRSNIQSVQTERSKYYLQQTFTNFRTQQVKNPRSNRTYKFNSIDKTYYQNTNYI